MAINPADITLSDEQREELAEIARSSGKSWEDVLSEALREFRSHTVASASQENGTPSTESLAASMKRHGLIGCIKGGPTDMSTNPLYMEGFGTS